MKKKTLVFGLFGGLFGGLIGAGVLTIAAGDLQAGEVKTKEKPKECGGYYDGQYHMKCEDEKTAREGYVERKHKWQNPFSGFGDTGSKPKKQGSMPYSR